MKTLLSFFCITCSCGETLAPFFSKKISVRWSDSWVSAQGGRKCQKCGAVWLKEDGYWRLLEAKDLEERDKRIAEGKKNFIAPDLSKWGI